MVRRHIPLLCILLALPAPGMAAGFASAAGISAACAAPVPDAANEKELKRLRAGSAASQPNVSCIAVLFGDSRDRILTFKPAADRSWFLTRILHAHSSEPSFEFSHTPVDAVHRLEKGWDAQRWALEAPGFRIAQESQLVLRRHDVRRRKAKDVRTVRVLRTFPIERDGTIADHLHVLVDDWGPWRGKKTPPERKWQIYSERANAVVLRSILYTGPGQMKWDSTDVNALVYLKGTQFDLVITRDELAPLRAFMKDFDVWAVE